MGFMQASYSRTISTDGWESCSPLWPS